MGGTEAAGLFDVARDALLCADPDDKCRRVNALESAWRSGALARSGSVPPRAVPRPGRPARPRLVAPRELARRRLGSPRGRAALVHALAHIEFNAINLALDAVYRFRDLPSGFYGDWLRVAREEARHFLMLRARLRELDHDYGDFDAHDGLWQAACDTAHDALARMALVPRVLEARGLDVTPGIMARLRVVGDRRTAACLAVILHDEIGHVAVGTRWFLHLCRQRGLVPRDTFRRLLREYMKNLPRGPLHVAARRQAGFSGAELDDLERMACGQ